MGLVYTHATRVMIWLGEDDDDDTALAFDVLRFFARKWNQRGLDSCQRINVLQLLGDFEVEGAQLELATPRPVKNLFQRSWFERTWVCEEFMLAKEAYVVCGHQEAMWGDFLDACTWMRVCGLFTPYEGAMMISLPTMESVRSMRFDFAPHFSLIRLLIHKRQQNHGSEGQGIWLAENGHTSRKSGARLWKDYCRSIYGDESTYHREPRLGGPQHSALPRAR
jgi:hypothetical protein